MDDEADDGGSDDGEELTSGEESDQEMLNAAAEPTLFVFNDTPVLSDEQKRIALERFELVSRKGVYPYEYVDSFERFDEPCLPAQDAFFSSLTGEGISDEEQDNFGRTDAHEGRK